MMGLRLGTSWRAVLRRAWSVRLWALSVACQAADVILSTRGAFSADPNARIALQLAGVALAAAGLIARIVAQRDLSDE